MEGDRSGIAHILSGVTQGSVLGPLLFLVYTEELNSIPLSPESSHVINADDVCIDRPISSCSHFRYVQEDIEVVDEWSMVNFLNVNPCLSLERGLPMFLRDLSCLVITPTKS